MNAYWWGGGGCRDIDPLIFDVGTRGVSGQPHAPASLPSVEEPRLQLNSDNFSA